VAQHRRAEPAPPTGQRRHLRDLALRLAQDELGAMLGVTRQSISKELRQLEQAGLIGADYNLITIRDYAGLHRLSQATRRSPRTTRAARHSGSATRRRNPQPSPHHRLFMPNTKGLAGCSRLVTSPLSVKTFFSTCNSRSPEPLLKSSFE
jgi:hypothetical protein